MSYSSVALEIATDSEASPRSKEHHVQEVFYYTLVFPVPSALEMPRVSYGDVCEMLRRVTVGGATRELRALDELRVAWIAKFRSGPPMAQDTISFALLQELMRDVIIARFSAVVGMTMRSRVESQGKGRILLSFRPSSTLLRATAERLNVRVPSSNRLEVRASDSKEGAKLWAQAEAQEELYRLFLADKITAEDAQIFKEEDSGMWSRRLRALQRVSSDAIDSQAEEDVLYLPFRDLTALRYVYEQIDDGGDTGEDIDGSTFSPFRMVDKIRLTKALIDAEFDCDALLERGLVEHHLCSHTFQTTSADTSFDVLRTQWGALPSPWRLIYRHSHVQEAQPKDPLLLVRNYFGEQIALYFAFARFLAIALAALGFVALVIAAVATMTSMSSEAEAAFCLCTCAFLGVFVRKWESQEARLAAQWSGGTPKQGGRSVNPLLLLPRPQFRGYMRRSPVTLRFEPYSPLRKQIARRFVSWLVLLALTLELSASSAIAVACNGFQTLLTDEAWGLNVALGVIVLISKCATPHLARYSRALTNWENHRLQRDYDSQLTFKFAVLQSANCFGSLWGLAFLRPLRCTLGYCHHVESGISSHDQAARLLLLTLGLDVLLALWALRWALWRSMCRTYEMKEDLTACREQRENADPTATLLASVSSSMDDLTIEMELALGPYDGVIFDYAQVLLPLGYVALFAPLSPLLSCVFVWLITVLQSCADADSLCYTTQRPFPIQTLSLGPWLGYLHVLRIGAVLHSIAFMLLNFTSDADISNKTLEQRVVALGALFALVGGAAYALKDHQDLTQERQLQVLRLKRAALERKYLGHLGTHLAASAKATLPTGRVFLNGLPRYVVTGDKDEQDAADELREQWRQQQMQLLALEKRLVELRDEQEEATSVGVLRVDVQGVSLLPITSPLSSFVQCSVQPKAPTAAIRDTRDCKTTSLPTQTVNTSVSKKSRSPLWHESLEMSLMSLEDVLALRLCDGGPMLSAVGQRRVLGRAQLGIEDVIARTSGNALLATASAPTSDLPNAAVTRTLETKPASPLVSRSSLSSQDEANDSTYLPPPVSSDRSSSLHAVDVLMATYELPLELPESLRRTKQSELAKHGPPRLTLRCGVHLNELGSLLVQQRRLREKLANLRSREVQLSNWGEV